MISVSPQRHHQRKVRELNPLSPRWGNHVSTVARPTSIRLPSNLSARQTVPSPGVEPGPTRSKRGMRSNYTTKASAEGEGVEPVMSVFQDAHVSNVARPAISGYLPFVSSFKARHKSVSSQKHQRKARESNPHFLVTENPKASGPGNPLSGYLPIMDRRGVEPRFPTCEVGVFPSLTNSPSKNSCGSRSRTDVRRLMRP